MNGMMDDIILRLLEESRHHDEACILLSNNFYDPYGKYQIMAGFGAEKEIFDSGAFNHDELWMGFCSYDLKNRLHHLQSNHPGAVSVPDYWFFKPSKHYLLNRNGEEYSNFELPIAYNSNATEESSLQFRCSTTKPEYCSNVEAIKNCIAQGDFYEMNYCLQFASNVRPDPIDSFIRLNAVSPAPYAVFLKFRGQYLLCESPERFIARRGDVLIAQPIKGTRRRLKNVNDDKAVCEELRNSEKDRAENIMIVDLIRNDMSRVCQPGTVEVTELCGIYSFSHVHQMISTVSGELKPDTQWPEIVEANFPMGSMTGAPKIQVMKDIERFENFSRGWYSGCVGYHYGSDFDFNVVIRSLQIPENGDSAYYHTGGAITFDSDAEAEYKECLDKAAGMFSALNAQLVSNL